MPNPRFSDTVVHPRPADAGFPMHLKDASGAKGSSRLQLVGKQSVVYQHVQVKTLVQCIGRPQVQLRIQDNSYTALAGDPVPFMLLFSSSNTSHRY